MKKEEGKHGGERLKDRHSLHGKRRIARSKNKRLVETHLRGGGMRAVPSGVWRRAFVRSCVSLLVTEAAPI